MIGTHFPTRSDLRPFSGVYVDLLLRLLNCPTEINERTGTRISVLPGGTSFVLDVSDRILPTCGVRKTYPKSAAAENAWYLSGERDVAWLRQYAPIWDKFVEPIRVPADEMPIVPSELGTAPESLRTITSERLGQTRELIGWEFDGVKSAYGYRWRHHFERDQIEMAIDALRRNPSDRRVVVSAWDPSSDGLGAQGQKNVPCPAMFTLNLFQGRLHSTMLMRSSDVFVGLPYDVMGHALLMDAVAKSLDVELGTMQFTLAHAHLYEAHWNMARSAIYEAVVVPPLTMPGWTVERIQEHRDDYVQLVHAMGRAFDWPAYAPRPEVIA